MKYIPYIVIVVLLIISGWLGYKFYTTDTSIECEEMTEAGRAIGDIFGGSAQFRVHKETGRGFLVLPQTYELIYSKQLIKENASTTMLGDFTVINVAGNNPPESYTGDMVEIRKKTEIK